MMDMSMFQQQSSKPVNPNAAFLQQCLASAEESGCSLILLHPYNP